MSKSIKIMVGVIGALVALTALIWAGMEISARHGMNHLYDKKMDI